MYVELFGASDRIGGNIGDMVAQLLYAFHEKIYIKYNRESLRVYCSYNQGYNESIFMQTIFDLIDYHNSLVTPNENDYIELAAPTHFEVWSRTLLKIQQDFFSYFKNFLYHKEFKELFIKHAQQKGYNVPFDPDNTILVHLRLEDVKNKPDYDGRICFDYFKDQIDLGLITDHHLNESLLQEYPFNSIQAPIPFNRIQEIIDEILVNNPEHEVIIITNPGEDLSTLPYKVLSHEDECYDLFLLCNCKKVILSRSNFALSSLFFGVAEQVHLPLWSVVACFGLNTKFDQTNFNYFV